MKCKLFWGNLARVGCRVVWCGVVWLGYLCLLHSGLRILMNARSQGKLIKRNPFTSATENYEYQLDTLRGLWWCKGFITEIFCIP